MTCFLRSRHLPRRKRWPMRDKLAQSRSSVLVSAPFVAGSLLLGVLAAFFGQGRLAAVLLFLFLLAGMSRLWAFASARRIRVGVSGSAWGLFPGEEITVDIRVRNEKFLPVVWMELFFPLAESLCLTPEKSRKPEEWELPGLREEGACAELVGEQRISALLWYETLTCSTRWRANRRGVYSMAGWRLRTGDGFGLTQTELPIPGKEVRQFAVYPRLVGVSPDLFLRNLWNADTGTRGVMEDNTVIRSTRGYMTSDSLKHINWRLTARGLPLMVNVYEDILPQSVHFLFDGESFSGPEPHLEEMEDALSVLASELVLLAARRVQCGLSLCRGKGRKALNLFAAESVQELLGALAAYEPESGKIDKDSGKILPQRPVFDEDSICEASQRVGRFYYIVYDTPSLADRKILRKLDRARTSILTYREGGPWGEFETIGLCGLKEGKGHG